MDLGCLDMGCIERQSRELSPDKESRSSNSSPGDSVMATSKIRKSRILKSVTEKGSLKENKAMKDAGQSSLSTLNKCTSQIRKPPHRKMSPLNWFPRKKVDSYLKRKIKLLQEVDGMNSTLDETLGDSNLHYSKVLKEKIAVREAATKAMEARKAAMVEASWCKILHAARIECKDAEAQLLETEKNAADAFEAATSIGVIMYDIAECPQKYYKIETAAAKEGGSTHAVSASFETAFEVDKQVASAVKVAFTKLANCPSINKDEFRELLRKISENPDSEEISQEFSSECESDTGSEFETRLNDDSLKNNHKKDLSGVKQMKFPKWQVSEKFNTSNLVEMMLERLRGLHEDELASLATIVATSGLNAALAEMGSHKKNEPDLILHVESGSLGNSCTDGGQTRGVTAAETELPSLDKFLVKRLTRLEREVLEAKNARKSVTKDGNQQKLDKSNHEKTRNFHNESSDFGTMLVKHSSKLEKEIAEARRKNAIAFGINCEKLDRRVNTEAEMPSLDKFLIRHVSRLEKEVQEAKNRRIFDREEGATVPKTKKSFSATNGTITEVSSAHSDEAPMGKENVDHNKSGDDGVTDMKKIGLAQEGSIQTSLQDHEIIKCLTGEAIPLEAEVLSQEDETHQNKDEENKHDNTKELPLRSNSRFQKNYMKCRGNGTISCESLDNVSVDRVSRLEKEKMKLHANGELMMKVKRKETDKESNRAAIMNKDGEESLDQILVKHKTRLEREKMAAAQQPEDQINHSLTRREAREKELEEAWGGLSLGNSIRPHISKLERHKISSEDQIRHSSVRKDAREKELQEAWGGLSLGNSIKPHVSKLERHKTSSEEGQIIKHSSHKEAREKELQDSWGGLSLGNSIRPHVSKLERHKNSLEDQIRHSSSARNEAREKELQEAWGGLSLGNSIKPHVSKLERHKTRSEDDQVIRHSSHKEAREKELQDSWGGLSLGNSIRPHLSRLEREKAAWLKAEEEERRRAMEQQS